MSDIKINHNATNFSDSINMSNQELLDLGEKLASFSMKVREDNKPPAEVAEWILTNLSYSELVFMAIKQIYETLDKSIKHFKKFKKDMPQELRDMLKNAKESGATIIKHKLDPSNPDDLNKLKNILSNLKAIDPSVPSVEDILNKAKETSSKSKFEELKEKLIGKNLKDNNNNDNSDKG